MEIQEQRLDEHTLEQLYGTMERPLYNVVYRWVWNRHDAQEIVQETFLRLWAMRESVEMTTVSPLTYRIALNIVRKRARRKKILSWVGLGQSEPVRDERASAELMMQCEERDASVRAAIESLSPRYRDVILLCEFSEMSYAEIASALDIKEGTVASRRHEAISRLRTKLVGWHPREAA